MENLGVTDVVVFLAITVQRELSLPADNGRRGKGPGRVTWSLERMLTEERQLCLTTAGLTAPLTRLLYEAV